MKTNLRVILIVVLGFALTGCRDKVNGWLRADDPSIVASLEKITPLGMPYEEVDRAIRSQFGSKLNGGSGVIKTFAHNISYTRGGSIRVLLGVYKQMSIEDVSVTAWYAFDDNQRLVRITVKKYVDSL